MSLSVLYVGTTWLGSTTSQRRRALEDLGCEVTTVDTGWRQRLPSMPMRLLRGLRRRSGRPMELRAENRAILEEVGSRSFDVAWIDKGLTIRPETLTEMRRLLPGVSMISFSADDMANPQNQSRYYRACVPLYDLHVTTKEPNVAELSAMGARQVFLVDNGYDPHTHRPVDLSEEDRRTYGADVSFVGGYERERAKILVRLAENGIRVRVWGNRWNLLRRPPRLLRLEMRPVFGDEYAKVLCATKINLAFLRKVNRDTQTTRSVEIPACGAFMLAERTEDHLRLFEEGREAVFFSSFEELRAGISHYLGHEEDRRRIAGEGRERCLRSAYSYAERLRGVVDVALGERISKVGGGR